MESSSSPVGTALERTVGRMEEDMAAIEAQGRDLDPLEADAFFAALTALSVGSYQLADVCLQVARGERNLHPPLAPAPPHLGLAGLRAALAEIKASAISRAVGPPGNDEDGGTAR
jgi:hypothetical protein